MFKSVLRILVGIIFMISAFVKGVDVIGFSFKLEEYFSPAVFNIPFFESQALLLAIIVVAFEFILGFFLLMKIRLRITLSLLIALCVFFAFLTFYSAYFNVVTDCGCFGDALKLEPWQSFWKDIVLLLALVLLYFLYRKDFQKNLSQSKTVRWITAAIFVVMAAIISWGILHEPIIDFRDYKIGTDLRLEKQKIAENPSEFKAFYSLKNKQTGEVREVNQDDYVNDKTYWDTNSPWEIEEGKTTSKLIRQGYESEIAKFQPETIEGENLTDEILSAPKAILIFSYHPKKINAGILAKAEAKINQQKNALIYGVSTNPETFKNIKNAVMDGTAIKTIARSNPFILTLENGKITDKRSAKDYIKQKN